MTQNEKEALLGYLEFHLLSFCESMDNHVETDALGTLYNGAYSILSDMEYSIQSHIDNMGDTVDTKIKR